MIERITPNNPLTERHAGMLAVLADKEVIGPIDYNARSGVWHCGHYLWNSDGASYIFDASCDIIAVMPMPDLSGLEGE